MTVTEIRNILESPYNQTVWKNFIQTQFTNNKLYGNQQSFELKDNPISKQCYLLGNYEIDDYTKIGIFEVQLNDKVNITRNRVALRNLIKEISSQLAGVMVVFVQGEKWRFSYISKRKVRNKTTNQIEDKETAPRRYTYLFGKNEKALTAAMRFDHLIQKQKGNLFELLSLNDFDEAFSVEKLSKDFFNKYKTIYEDFVEYLTGKRYNKKGNNSSKDALTEPNEQLSTLFENDEKQARDFCKRMMGRIVFLCFIEKKGWLAVPQGKEWGEGNPNYLSDLFYQSKQKNNFYSQELVPLFFTTLNNPDSENIKNTLRFPYLNGGLFDDSKDKKYNNLQLPQELFNTLFSTFKEFNFTVYEDAPDEHTVAVDPEMLGHIFENLLEDNNDKGAFYTPKDIVHYMCQQSLVEYLAIKLNNTDKNILRNIIEQNELNEEEAEYRENNAYKIIDALVEVKICDPAIGSGAFPMGLLQEIFNTQIYLHELKGFKKGKTDADIKKHIIEKSIYGVDIDAGAVDIARLRCWLSLVVEEQKPQPLPNLDFKIMQGDSLTESFEGIDLQKVHTVRTSVSTFEPQKDIFGRVLDSQIKLTDVKILQESNLPKLMLKFFSETNPIKKGELRETINQTVHNHIDYNLELWQNNLERQIAEAPSLDNETIKKASTKRKIIEWQNQLITLKNKREKLHTIQNKNSKPYFLWHLYFKDVFDNGGFDIVIGNPPYVQLQKGGGSLAKLYENLGFATFERTGDLYSLFYEKGVQLLKPDGILCYITSNKWMRTNYGASTRQFFAEKTHPLLLIDFGNVQVFETATVDTNILILKNKPKATKHDGNELFAVRFDTNYDINQQSISAYTQERSYYMAALNQNAWVVGEKDTYNIKEAIEEQGTPLTKWKITINYGIKTGYNEAFIIDAKTKSTLIEEDPKSSEILKPILRGKDISAWYPDFADLWLINSHNGVKSTSTKKIDVEKNYPAVYNWLNKYKDVLKNRNDIGDHWTNLRNCAYINEFEKPKIMYPNMTKYMPFVYDENDHYYSNDKSFILTGSHLKYLTCFFNSKLFKYCFSDNFPELQGGTRELRKVFFDKIPVKPIQPEHEPAFNKLTDYLVALKKEKTTDNTDKFIAIYFEQIANALVYEHYFEEDFKNADLSVAQHILPLPDIDPDKDILIQLRKIYVVVNNSHSPVKNAVQRMVAIPQINLINTTIN